MTSPGTPISDKEARIIARILNKYGSEDVHGDIGALMSAKASQANPDPNLGGRPRRVRRPGLPQLDRAEVRARRSTRPRASSPCWPPLILGALSKKKNQTGGAGLDGLASLIDRDGDGNILDDIAGFLGPALGRELRFGGERRPAREHPRRAVRKKR
ncbi:MAG: DUF937 domain-containing protein [Marinilabiliales bacterium]|nr:DUF937 domain-containing protein [Marinilabiliales bacterium]